MNTLTDAQLIVSPEVASLVDAAGAAADGRPACSPDAAAALLEHGFFVREPLAERAALETHFAAVRADASELRVTVLTTMQCNFACEYCYQRDDGADSETSRTMSLETAGLVAAWIETELTRVGPARLVVTFFGGEPLLNLPAVYEIAGRLSTFARGRGTEFVVTVITNGLLLTPDVVTRLLPLGLRAVKVTLDGDRETHDRVRHMRGGQGTFDRIVENMRRVAALVPLSVGGNFDVGTVERYPALLAFLKAQDFAPHIAEVSFKPVIPPVRPQGPAGRALRPAAASDGRASVSGACSGGAVCDSCHFADDQWAFLQGETRRHGFATIDGVHMGPCELYRQHSHTIGPDGSMFACPGFTGNHAQSVGHVGRRPDLLQSATAARFARLAPWRQCGDCGFIPVCGGGCAVAAQAERGDARAPSCHKRAFESALVTLAEEKAAAFTGELSCASSS